MHQLEVGIDITSVNYINLFDEQIIMRAPWREMFVSKFEIFLYRALLIDFCPHFERES